VTEAVPLPAVIVLADGLREARTRRRIGLRRLADMVDLHPGVLSAFELGKRTPPDATVARILGVLRASNTVCDQLIDLARRSHERDFIDHTGRDQYLLRTTYEQRSTHVIEWAPSLIPEALQTDDYAHALQHTGLLDSDAADVGHLTRRARQLAVSDETAPRYTYLIGEAATRPDACTPAVLRDQLGELAGRARHPRMSVRLVPATACPPGLVEPFTLYEHRAGVFAVAARHLQGAMFLTHAAVLATYEQAAQSLQRRATENAWP
jgi:transcriptional regulator with XRE-family HTH domain